jgi:putative hydrolase of the HAD superfamily
VSQSDRVVFWDFDGTLAVRQDLWSGALADAWSGVAPSRPVTAAELSPCLGAGFPWHDPNAVAPPLSPEQWWAKLRPVFIGAYTSAGLDHERAEQAALRVPVEYYRPDAWTLIDGAVDALRTTAAAGYRNIILSNHAPELPGLVSALGLGSLVESTITSAAVGAEKPSPAIFAYALASAAVSAQSVWMVGDNPTADIAGALSAGIRGILADGIHPDSVGVTVLEAARQIARAGT